MVAQSGGSAFPDTAAVPLADGGTGVYAKEIRQIGGAAGIHGVSLFKTEKFPGGFDASRDCAFRLHTAMCVRPEEGFDGWWMVYRATSF